MDIFRFSSGEIRTEIQTTAVAFEWETPRRHPRPTDTPLSPPLLSNTCHPIGQYNCHFINCLNAIGYHCIPTRGLKGRIVDCQRGQMLLRKVNGHLGSRLPLPRYQKYIQWSNMAACFLPICPSWGVFQFSSKLALMWWLSKLWVRQSDVIFKYSCACYGRFPHPQFCEHQDLSVSLVVE